MTGEEGGLALIGQGAAQLLGQALSALPPWQALMTNVRSIRQQVHDIRRSLVALTAAQQQAINDLSNGINTLATNLADVLDAAQDVRDELAAMSAEEGREQAERERLQALLDQMDGDVVNALQPLTQQVDQMNNSLQTPASQGGGAIGPNEPTEEPGTGGTGIVGVEPASGEV
jgi:uncharacterized phage infection (PIP) family protein YhgE